MWEKCFVATSILVGASLEEALASLSEGTEALLGDLPARLRDGRKAIRATALAEVAHLVARAVEGTAPR